MTKKTEKSSFSIKLINSKGNQFWKVFDKESPDSEVFTRWFNTYAEAKKHRASLIRDYERDDDEDDEVEDLVDQMSRNQFGDIDDDDESGERY